MEANCVSYAKLILMQMGQLYSLKMRRLNAKCDETHKGWLHLQAKSFQGKNRKKRNHRVLFTQIAVETQTLVTKTAQKNSVALMAKQIMLLYKLKIQHLHS